VQLGRLSYLARCQGEHHSSSFTAGSLGSLKLFRMFGWSRCGIRGDVLYRIEGMGLESRLSVDGFDVLTAVWASEESA
jgi:hypothetical protein